FNSIYNQFFQSENVDYPCSEMFQTREYILRECLQYVDWQRPILESDSRDETGKPRHAIDIPSFDNEPDPEESNNKSDDERIGCCNLDASRTKASCGLPFSMNVIHLAKIHQPVALRSSAVVAQNTNTIRQWFGAVEPKTLQQTVVNKNQAPLFYETRLNF
ncbi:hypothetical protein B0H19DRAFT_925563, partial [Mycena capillaripes]